MSEGAEEAASEYRLALENLKDNNKMQINLLTILAEDYNSYSKEIIRVVAQQVEKVPPVQKLAVVYVMDSILKNLNSTTNYKEHIEKNIHKVFVHVFETGDERTRLSLHKLRQTWNDYFMASTLYKIDIAVHGIDPAWPIVTPQPHSVASTSAAPQVATQPQASHPSTATMHSARNSKVHVNPHFFQKSSVANGQQQLPTAATERKPAADPRLARAAVATGRGASGKNADAPANRPAKEHKQAFNPAAVKREITDSPSDVDERMVPEPIDDKTGIKPYRRWAEPPTGGRHSPQDGLKRRNAVGEVVVEEKRSRNVRTPPSDFGDQQPSTSAALPRPTNNPGTHAFVSAVPFRPAYPAMIPQVVPTIAGVMPMVPSSSTPYVTAEMPMIPIPGMPPMLPSQLQMPPLLPQGAPMLAPGVPMTTIVAPMMAPPVMSLAPTVPAVAPVISADAPKLEGIPANNRIFVDGRAYEVFYIEDIPVIERNSLPHRIYFTGAPRNVIIDGVAHLMRFGEEKRVVIDGEEHVLRFGAPSRELYMGNYPFKGAFGGPPIFGTINGVRHEIRLGGPPPEVKIEPDPCYELLPHMPRKSNKPPVQSAEPTKEPSVDVKGLLAKLQRSGFLSSLKAASASGARRDESGGDSPNRAATPPIPAEHRGEVTDRMAKPPSDFKNFSMRALKIRYDSVIESLHKTRHICPNCGLRFNELTGEKYQQHLDWHFQENLRSSDKPRCRDWYMPLEAWLEHAEQKDLSAPTTSQSPLNANTEDAHKDGGRKRKVPYDSVETKECNVCKEKFEEYWDGDEDTWILKDCVLGSDGRPFHTGCILDASSVQRGAGEEEAEEEDENCDKSLFLAADAKLKRQLLSAS